MYFVYFQNTCIFFIENKLIEIKINFLLDNKNRKPSLVKFTDTSLLKYCFMIWFSLMKDCKVYSLSIQKGHENLLERVKCQNKYGFTIGILISACTIDFNISTSHFMK